MKLKCSNVAEPTSPNGKLRKVGAARDGRKLSNFSLSLSGIWHLVPSTARAKKQQSRAEASAEISFVWLPRKRGQTMGHTSKIKCELILVSVVLCLAVCMYNLISRRLLFQDLLSQDLVITRFMQQERAQRKQVMKSLLPFQLIVSRSQGRFAYELPWRSFVQSPLKSFAFFWPLHCFVFSLPKLK